MRSRTAHEKENTSRQKTQDTRTGRGAERIGNKRSMAKKRKLSVEKRQGFRLKIRFLCLSRTAQSEADLQGFSHSLSPTSTLSRNPVLR